MLPVRSCTYDVLQTRQNSPGRSNLQKVESAAGCQHEGACGHVGRGASQLLGDITERQRRHDRASVHDERDGPDRRLVHADLVEKVEREVHLTDVDDESSAHVDHADLRRRQEREKERNKQTNISDKSLKKKKKKREKKCNLCLQTQRFSSRRTI